MIYIMFAKDSMRKIKEKQKIYDYTREKLQNQLDKSCAFGRI